jgi:hypothetical protein
LATVIAGAVAWQQTGDPEGDVQNVDDNLEAGLRPNLGVANDFSIQSLYDSVIQTIGPITESVIDTVVQVVAQVGAMEMRRRYPVQMLAFDFAAQAFQMDLNRQAPPLPPLDLNTVVIEVLDDDVALPELRGAISPNWEDTWEDEEFFNDNSEKNLQAEIAAQSARVQAARDIARAGEVEETVTLSRNEDGGMDVNVNGRVSTIESMSDSLVNEFNKRIQAQEQPETIRGQTQPVSDVIQDRNEILAAMRRAEKRMQAAHDARHEKERKEELARKHKLRREKRKEKQIMFTEQLRSWDASTKAFQQTHQTVISDYYTARDNLHAVQNSNHLDPARWRNGDDAVLAAAEASEYVDQRFGDTYILGLTREEALNPTTRAQYEYDVAQAHMRHQVDVVAKEVADKAFRDHRMATHKWNKTHPKHLHRAGHTREEWDLLQAKNLSQEKTLAELDVLPEYSKRKRDDQDDGDWERFWKDVDHLLGPDL